MKQQVPQDFIQEGHVRPIAWVRDMAPSAGVWIKDTQLKNPNDFEALAIWLLQARDWCFGPKTVNLSNGGDQGKEDVYEVQESSRTEVCDQTRPLGQRKKKANKL